MTQRKRTTQTSLVCFRGGVIQVEHFGDITKLDGHKLPAVDVIIGGSPC